MILKLMIQQRPLSKPFKYGVSKRNAEKIFSTLASDTKLNLPSIDINNLVAAKGQ